jgi:hypothetical protein
MSGPSRTRHSRGIVPPERATDAKQKASYKASQGHRLRDDGRYRPGQAALASLRALTPTPLSGERGPFRATSGMSTSPHASPQPWHEPVADVARVVDVALQLAS